MGWETRVVFNKEGIGKEVNKPKQFCDECGKEVEILFKAGRTAEDWFFMECDFCGEPACADCSEWDEERESRFCVTCLQDPNLEKKFKKREENQNEK